MTARTPIAKAFITGAAQRNPARYVGRNSPQLSNLGDPPDCLTDDERKAWLNFEGELPWLNRSHRAMVHVASILRAKVESGTDGINHMQVYSACLSKLGASPADEGRIAWSEDDDDDDEFFGAA